MNVSKNITYVACMENIGLVTYGEDRRDLVDAISKTIGFDASINILPCSKGLSDLLRGEDAQMFRCKISIYKGVAHLSKELRIFD